VVAVVSRKGSGSVRLLLFILFGNMIFGFTIGLPVVSVMGLIGIVVTVLWHLSDDEADQRRIQEESRLRLKIEELEKRA
jgi:hypothetical protein